MKALYVEANVINMNAKYQLYPPNGFWEEVFLTFIQNFILYAARQPIKFSDLDKSLKKRRGLLNN